MPDPQADRVIDRLMAERERALATAHAQDSLKESKVMDTVDTRLAEAGAKEPAKRDEIQRIIEEKGEVSTKDLLRLVARDSRRGM